MVDIQLVEDALSPGESKQAALLPGGVVKERAARQSYSCAECRRLKLKCSRSWPCTSCEKRGCPQICPTGSMRTGKGKKPILADTEELHARISELELALAQSQAEQNTTPHPLLSSTYLFSPRDQTRLKPPTQRLPANDDGAAGEGSDGADETRAGLRPRARSGSTAAVDPRLTAGGAEDVVDAAFGTLTIGQSGEARFVGSFAGSEYLRTGTGKGSDDSEEGSGGEGEGSLRSSIVPDPRPLRGGRGVSFHTQLATPPNSAPPGASFAVRPPADAVTVSGHSRPVDEVDALRRQLPDWHGEGKDLMQAYWDNVNWMYTIIPQKMFEEEYQPPAYDLCQTVHPHKLAVVFLAMAVGVMFDLHRPPFDPRGEELFALGQECLAVVGLERAMPATIRALHLSGTFTLNDKKGSGAEIFWPVLGTAIKVAYGLGLHRDGTAFGLRAAETEERRLVWWELVMYDRLQAMCFARPGGTANRTMDTKFPDPALVGDTDQFHATKYRVVQLMEKVIDVQTQVAPVAYSAISQLDAEFVTLKRSIPSALLPTYPIQSLPLDPSVPPHLVIHRLVVRLLIAQCRLLLSRPFFARSLSENKDDPAFAKHGASFLALYESAQEIVYVVKHLVIYHPSLIARWWFFWFHAFSSACCFAAIAIQAPDSPFANPAFEGLSIVCDIAAAAREGCRAKKGLPVLIRLRERAKESMRKAGRQGAIHGANPRLPARHFPALNPPATSAVSKSALGVAARDESAVDSTDDDDLLHLSGGSKLKRMSESHVRTGRRRSSAGQGQATRLTLGAGNGAASPNTRQTSTVSPTLHPVDPALQSGSTLSERYCGPGLPPIGSLGRTTTPLIGGYGNTGFSPRSVTSEATSLTLAERTWEGIVPPPPPLDAVSPVFGFTLGEPPLGSGTAGSGLPLAVPGRGAPALATPATGSTLQQQQQQQQPFNGNPQMLHTRTLSSSGTSPSFFSPVNHSAYLPTTASSGYGDILAESSRTGYPWSPPMTAVSMGQYSADHHHHQQQQQQQPGSSYQPGQSSYGIAYDLGQGGQHAVAGQDLGLTTLLAGPSFPAPYAPSSFGQSRAGVRPNAGPNVGTDWSLNDTGGLIDFDLDMDLSMALGGIGLPPAQSSGAGGADSVGGEGERGGAEGVGYGTFEWDNWINTNA